MLYAFSFIPKFKEVVKIMDDSEQEEYLNKCCAVQKDVLDIFISEGIFKQGRILQFQTLVKPRRVLLLPTCNCETCHSRRNQAVQSVGLYVLGQEGLGETTTIHALETHLLDL